LDGVCHDLILFIDDFAQGHRRTFRSPPPSLLQTELAEHDIERDVTRPARHRKENVIRRDLSKTGVRSR
jgi:hypothetical protein